MQTNERTGNNEIENRPLQALMDQLTLAQLRDHKLLGLATSRRSLREDWLRLGQTKLIENLRRQALAQSLIDELGERIARVPNRPQIGLLKGAALWEDLYRPGEREASDIDLFVDVSQLPTLANELNAMGFILVPEPKSRASEFKTLYAHPAHQDLTIEIHTKLWWREPAGFSWQWRPAVRAPFFRLSNEDQLIHLCGHWAAQHTMISLHWLVDIFLFIEHRPFDWSLVESRARLLKLSRSVEIAREACLLVEAPNRKTSLVGLSFLKNPRRNLLRYLWLKHRVQDSWREALGYDLQWTAAWLKSRVRPSREDA